MGSVVVYTRDDLSGAQKRIAAQAIEELHTAYYERGGLHDLTERAREKAKGVAQHIFKLAVYAAKQHEGDLEQAAELFGALCKHAEAEYKERHKVVNLKETLPVWAVFKSNILGAMSDGLSPLEYRSEHALRDARAAQNSEEEDEAPRRALPPPGRRRALPQEDVEEFLDTTTMPKPLRTLTSSIVVTLEHLRPSKRDEAEVVMRETSERLAALVDRRRAGAPS
jgi:hypothetical protein